MKAFVTWVALAVAAVLAGLLIWGLYLSPDRAGAPPVRLAQASRFNLPPEAFQPPPPLPPPGACQSAPAFRDAAVANAASVTTSDWKPFARPADPAKPVQAAPVQAAPIPAAPVSHGWEIYLPLVQREIATSCGAGEEGFAEALSAWQSSHRMKATGVMDAATFDALRVTWLTRRPFVKAMARGCPAAPAEDRLVPIPAAEAYGGKGMKLRPAALEAWERMVEAARREEPAIAADRNALKILSAWRDPVMDGVRCAFSEDCGLARAPCSAHRTGLAVDLYLGSAPGMDPASTDDANRLWQSRTPAYRWLVRNADRFGFVNYPYEPWHWEWTGEAVD